MNKPTRAISLIVIGCFAILLLFLPGAVSQAKPPLIHLTIEEKQWLAEHRTVRLGGGIAFPPFQWVEQKNTDYYFRGMVSDYIDLLEKRLDLNMEVEFGITFDQALERGRARVIDLFPCLSQTPERSEFLLFTEPYLSYPLVIIAREGAPLIGGLEDLRGKKVAVVKFLFIYSSLTHDHADLNLEFVETQNVGENLEAVSTGRADACIINLAVASYLIQKKGLANLSIMAPVAWEQYQLRMGVRKDWPVFRRILAKTLAMVTQEEKDAISQRWINIDYRFGIDVRKIRRWALGFGLGSALLFAFIIIWNRRLSREIHERKRAEKEREETIAELRKALAEVKTLQGFLPICANCKKVRDDEGYWQQIEKYIHDRSEATFSHSICPDCMRALYPDVAEQVLNEASKGRE